MATKKASLVPSIGRQLSFTTGRMNALCQQILEPHDLSLQQWVILACLWRDGALTVGALAEAVGTGVPAMSRILDRMVARDLVARRRHETDRRTIIVEVTDKGQGLSHLADFYQTINATLFRDFSDAEAQMAFDLLVRMQANAEVALAAGSSSADPTG